MFCLYSTRILRVVQFRNTLRRKFCWKKKNNFAIGIYLRIGFSGTVWSYIILVTVDSHNFSSKQKMISYVRPDWTKYTTEPSFENGL